MDQQTATIIAGGILGGTAMVWLCAVWLQFKLGSAPSYYSSTQTIENTSPDEALRGVARMFAHGGNVLRREGALLEVQRMGVTSTFEVEPDGDGTRLKIEWDSTGFTRYFRLGLLAWNFFVTPVVVCGVSYLIWRLVLHSDDPQVRWQVLQMLQVIHVLWPPFLIYFIHKRIIKVERRSLDNLQHMI